MWTRRLVLPLFVASIAFLVSAASPGTAQAKGRSAKLIVYSDGTAVEVATPSLSAFDSFADFSESIPQPRDIFDEGFWIIRYGLDEESGEYRAFDRLRLVPAANSSGTSVYYEGLMSGWSEYDAKWYRGQPGVLAMLRSSLEKARSPNYSMPSMSDLSIAGVGVLLGVRLALILNSFYRGRYDQRR